MYDLEIIKKNCLLSLEFSFNDIGKSFNIKHILFSKNVIYFKNLNDKSFWKHKAFFTQLFNLTPKTYFNLANVFLMIQKLSKTIFYTNLFKRKFDSNKRSKRSAQQKDNCYKIDKRLFNKIWNFFPDVSPYDFFKITSIYKIKKERLSTKFYIFSISHFDQILTQLDFVDVMMSESESQFCVKRENLLSYFFKKIHFTHYQFQACICNSICICTEKCNFYGEHLFDINIYSRLYLLNTFLLYDSKIYYNLFTNTELQMLKSLLNNNLHPEMKQFSIEMHNYYDELFPQTNYELFPAISSQKKPV